MQAEEILDHIETIFPETPCELRNDGEWQFAIAVALSPQTTDRNVNLVTEKLFAAYPTLESIARADPEAIEQILRPLGYARVKSRNLIAMCRQLIEKHGGRVPADIEALMELPGIGRKCACVIGENLFGIPVMAVDTHVERLAKRLGLAGFEDNVRVVEDKLTRAIPENRLGKAHHDFIHFGRYFCTAKNPHCDQCPFADFCREKEYASYRAGQKARKAARREARKSPSPDPKKSA